MKRAKALPKGANENVLQVLTVDLNRLYTLALTMKDISGLSHIKYCLPDGG